MQYLSAHVTVCVRVRVIVTVSEMVTVRVSKGLRLGLASGFRFHEWVRVKHMVGELLGLVLVLGLVLWLRLG